MTCASSWNYILEYFCSLIYIDILYFHNIVSSYVYYEYVQVGCNADISGELADSISSYAETGTTPEPNIDDSSKYSVIQNFYIEIWFTEV